MPPVPGRNADHAILKRILDAQYEAFNVEDSATDPVQFVHRTQADPADRELVGFIAAGLAFGRVASVMASVGRVVEVMGAHPARYVRDFDPRRDARALTPVVHRWIRGADLVALMLVLQAMLREHGSLEGAFVAGHDPAAADVGPALDAFAARACAVDVRPAYGRAVPDRAGYRYFFARPSGGSACKRLNLFLRWMVRRDAVDPGVLDARVAVAAGGAARHPHHPAGSVPRPDAADDPGLEDGGGDHGGAAPPRPRRSHPLRLRALPPRDDEGLPLRPGPHAPRVPTGRVV